jgi:hypothetical protein
MSHSRVETPSSSQSGQGVRGIGSPGGLPCSTRPSACSTRAHRGFYRYPAEHWVRLRTTNPIESTFATVRLRQRVTKGPGSRAAGVAIAFKLIESAQQRWRSVNAPPRQSSAAPYERDRDASR